LTKGGVMSRKETYHFMPDYAVAPGESLREAIEDMGMSQVEFAQRMGLTVQSLSRILKGDQPITFETARKLELVTGISCEFWNNLEARYRERLQLISLQQQHSEFNEFNKSFPIKVLAKRRYIELSDNAVAQGMELLRFFQISSIKAFSIYRDTTMAQARSSSAFSTDATLAITYINMGLHQSRKISAEPYDETRFKQVLHQVRALTQELPENFCVVLQELFASAGVALVFVPPFPGVHFSGVSKWISPSRAMIIMNIRGKMEDKFWFSLFHEAAHILLHSKKRIFITDNTPEDPEEKEADSYAADFLIPSQFNERIQTATSAAQIRAIANELGISQGIVAGRYQHLTQRWHQFRSLITRLEWVDDAD